MIDVISKKPRCFQHINIWCDKKKISCSDVYFRNPQIQSLFNLFSAQHFLKNVKNFNFFFWNSNFQTGLKACSLWVRSSFWYQKKGIFILLYSHVFLAWRVKMHKILSFFLQVKVVKPLKVYRYFSKAF